MKLLFFFTAKSESLSGNPSLSNSHSHIASRTSRFFQPGRFSHARTRPTWGTFPLGEGACKSSHKQPGGGARLAVLARAAGLLPPAEWGSAEPAGVSAVSSSAGLIPRHSIEAPVITKARPVGQWLMWDS